MFEAIGYNLSNLANFSGRDSRSTFWFYVLFLVIIQIVVSFALSMLAGGAMLADMFSMDRGGADGAAIKQQMLTGMGDMVRISMWGGVLMSLLMTILLAAAFTRRLHDSNNRGWIAGVTVAMQLLSIVLTVGMIDEMATFMTSMNLNDPVAMQAAMQAQQGKYALSGALGWLPVLSVVVFGVWPSNDGDNRYGPEPDHL